MMRWIGTRRTPGAEQIILFSELFETRFRRGCGGLFCDRLSPRTDGQEERDGEECGPLGCQSYRVRVGEGCGALGTTILPSQFPIVNSHHSTIISILFLFIHSS